SSGRRHTTFSRDWSSDVCSSDLAAQRGSTLEIRFPGDWYDHPTYLDALAERMEEALQGLSPEERAETPVIFSAHSIPTRFVEQGDPYVEQLRAAAAGIHDRVGPFPWELAFQSVGQASREPWVGP